jgi:hypothetical protein
MIGPYQAAEMNGPDVIGKIHNELGKISERLHEIHKEEKIPTLKELQRFVKFFLIPSFFRLNPLDSMEVGLDSVWELLKKGSNFITSIFFREFLDERLRN